eukprot:UN19474
MGHLVYICTIHFGFLGHPVYIYMFKNLDHTVYIYSVILFLEHTVYIYSVKFSQQHPVQILDNLCAFSAWNFQQKR